MVNDTSILIIVAAIIPIAIMAYLFYRLNRNQMQQVQDLKDRIFDFPGNPDQATQLDARVLESKTTISPKADKIARVDLRLQIHRQDGTPYEAQATWLVEIDALARVEVGSTVPVILDLRKPDRVYPNFSEAKAWVF